MLQANGRVYISNPNGIIFGQNATVNVGALLATTLDIANADFLNGVIKLQGDSQAGIENHSQQLSAHEFVALVGQRIENTGAIHANQVALVAASEVEIDNAYGGAISVDVSGLLGSVNNSGDFAGWGVHPQSHRRFNYYERQHGNAFRRCHREASQQFRRWIYTNQR